MRKLPARRRHPLSQEEGAGAWIFRRFNEAREEEARRIARVLHDESTQLLTAMQIALDDALRGMPEETRAKFSRVNALIATVQEHLRHLSHELAPEVLTELGLEEAVRYLAHGCAARYGIHANVTCHLEGRVSKSAETAVYRIIQEAISNVCRHASASHVDVQLEDRGHELRVVVRDDGTGFELDAARSEGRAGGLGLRSMAERAESLGGRLRIRSSEGQGTTITASIPVRIRRRRSAASAASAG